MAAFRGRQQPKLMWKAQILELLCELKRPAAQHVSMVTADGNVEADTTRKQLRLLRAHEQTRIMGVKLGSCRMRERPIAENGGEIALPGTQRAEQPRMAQTDIDCAVAARTQSLERTPARARNRRR